MKRILIGVALTLVPLTGALVLAARGFSAKLLYPAPQSDPMAPAEGTLLTTIARDGVTVRATEIAGPKGAPVVVVFHGNGVVMGDELWLARELRHRGFGVVLCEYRGYGLSARKDTPAPSEAGLFADAEAILRLQVNRGVDAGRIILFGQSLGTGVAIEMAAQKLGSALILVTPYTSIPEVGARITFGTPPQWLVADHFDSLSRAPLVRTRSLVIHGTKDEVVPYSMGKRLTYALRNAGLITVEGGHHNDLFQLEGAKLLDQIAEFAKAAP